MKRRGNPKEPLLPVGDILRKWFNKRKFRAHFLDRAVLDGWKRAVGPQIAGNTRPFMVKDRALFVKVRSSVWMHQLQFMKQDILEKVNRQLGGTPSLGNIFFSIGTFDRPDQETSPPSPLSDRDREWIDRQVSALRDEELREILKKTMARSLISGKERDRR